VDPAAEPSMSASRSPRRNASACIQHVAQSVPGAVVFGTALTHRAPSLSAPRVGFIPGACWSAASPMRAPASRAHRTRLNRPGMPRPGPWRKALSASMMCWYRGRTTSRAQARAGKHAATCRGCRRMSTRVVARVGGGRSPRLTGTTASTSDRVTPDQLARRPRERGTGSRLRTRGGTRPAA
jgi:hypothetical protein